MSDTPTLHILYPEPDEHDDAQPATVDTRLSCPHRNFKLNKEARRIYCRSCENEVDAFTVVLKFAQDWEYIQGWRREAERRNTLARERLEATLRAEKNARARVKKLDPQEPLPKKPWGEGMPL